MLQLFCAAHSLFFKVCLEEHGYFFLQRNLVDFYFALLFCQMSAMKPLQQQEEWYPYWPFLNPTIQESNKMQLEQFSTSHNQVLGCRGFISMGQVHWHRNLWQGKLIIKAIVFFKMKYFNSSTMLNHVYSAGKSIDSNWAYSQKMLFLVLSMQWW